MPLRTIYLYLITFSLPLTNAFAGTGLTEGDSFVIAKIKGEISATCRYDNGEGRALHECEMEVLHPSIYSKFQTNLPSRARKVELSVLREDGSTVSYRYQFNSRTGKTVNDISLWKRNNWGEEPLLMIGENKFSYQLILANGDVEQVGIFYVTVEEGTSEPLLCHNGRMTSGSPRACQHPTPQSMCNQYFGYENYCQYD